MLECDACQRLIADHDAADALPATVQDHIARCSECAAALAEERLVRRAIAIAPWPAPTHARNLPAMTRFAAAREAERRLRSRRMVRRWSSGLGLVAVIAPLVMWAVGQTGRGAGYGWLRTAVPMGLGITALAWLDIVGRRLTAAGATTGMQLGVGLGRVAIGLALVVAVIEPSRLAELPYTVARLAGGPAEAQVGIVEAELLCAAAGDGRLRLARASEGCRGHEVAVALDGRAGGDGAPALDGLAIRFGTATIPAGERGVEIKFASPMDSANYQVLFSPHNLGRPIALDDACHILGVGGKSTDRFSVALWRCWYEGIDVPHDRVASDVSVDWMVVGGR